MRVEDVDERDTEWEIHTPVVRAYFWTDNRSSLACVDVLDATVPVATAWAEDEAETRGADLDLAIRIADNRGLLGLVWLMGDGVARRPIA